MPRPDAHERPAHVVVVRDGDIIWGRPIFRAPELVIPSVPAKLVRQIPRPAPLSEVRIRYS